ncbi:hypothetical protein CPB84DRAFT_1747315 [Gymnopilus junonius]|uniref:Uncharacterized protein n=1 Tax=Gymnopilus junonius TaxID=109634 RepID=A0A9P5TN55_GYMJU|nr:hypothetical protein CPB84DRAFT_1747315 [Gymnopilus junonius]
MSKFSMTVPELTMIPRPVQTRTLSVRHLPSLDLAFYKLKLKLRAFKRSKYKSFGFCVSWRACLTDRGPYNGVHSQNASIPVPHVFDVFEYKKSVNILEEIIAGDLLVNVRSSLDLEAQLRWRVEAVDGTCCQDDKVWTAGTGPFDNIGDFNKLLSYDLFDSDASCYAEIQEPLKRIAGAQMANCLLSW